MVLRVSMSLCLSIVAPEVLIICPPAIQRSFFYVYHPLYVCPFLVNNRTLSFVNRYSNCNNASQHSHDEEEDASSSEAKKPEDEEGANVTSTDPTSSATTESEEATVAQKLEEAIMTTILPKLIHPTAETSDNENTDKLSCHDSGIDIRDPAILQQLLLQANKLPQAPPKKYSDADIVLSDDWVPPIPLVTPLGVSHLTTSGYEQQHDRKKASSVSFSVDEAEPQNALADKSGGEKKNKVIDDNS